MTSQQEADELLAEYWAERAQYEHELELVYEEMTKCLIFISDLPCALSEAL